eukprot:TRINITY_DN7426_c1_g1_i1.p1 TRINITY_DN7426_c1_g1~~TRINITY_DN7426_c1_g1_i1.p1  ORF type:complete len:326 (+),score=68.53 TRINITY_DN7426_c1_g1_i1:718-1695(+)
MSYLRPGCVFVSLVLLSSFILFYPRNHFSLKQSPNVEAWARWRAPPSHINNDASTTLGSTDKMVRFDSPRPGLWIFGVRSTGVDHVGFKLRVGTCPNGLAGPSCNISYGEAVNDFNLSTVSNLYQYWKVNVDSTTPLWVSVSSFNTNYPAPSLLASMGQIPTWKNSDISNCNQAFCQLVPSIVQYPVENFTFWIVGVTSPAASYIATTTATTTTTTTTTTAATTTATATVAAATTAAIPYAIWYNRSCIPGCNISNHGYCMPSGTCHCNNKYYGVDCGRVDGLATQYVVVIMVACVMVASTISGLAVCGTLRSKNLSPYARYHLL